MLGTIFTLSFFGTDFLKVFPFFLMSNKLQNFERLKKQAFHNPNTYYCLLFLVFC